MTFSKDLLKEKEDTNISKKLDQLNLNSETKLSSNIQSIYRKKLIKPELDTKESSKHTRGSPLLRIKSQFGPVHSNLDQPNKQKKKLGEDMLKKANIFEKSLNKQDPFQNLSSKKDLPRTQRIINETENLDQFLKITSLNSELAKLSQKIKSMEDLEVCDLSDLEIDIQSPSKQTEKIKAVSRPVTISEACELKKLLFGSTAVSFGPEWRRQAFTFSNNENVPYGLTQNKGGPCGILAAVQAHVLCELLFNCYHDNCANGRLRPTPQACSKALVRALSNILWRAGSKKSAVVALSSGRQVIDVHNTILGKLQCDCLTEQLVLNTFDCFNTLSNFIKEKINEFQNDGKDGCIIFLYSMIFSHGIQSIKEEMDDPNAYLIGRHGYCTQEMVNLLLVGKAVSNVFDDDMELNTGGTEKTILRGIKCNSDIGLLSLFEHYNSCKVGNNYKNPHYPIWVVLSESHFSVLFSISMEEIKSGRPFNLFYFDGLTHQTEEICLTIDPSPNQKVNCDNDLTPPLELCICTKWNGAHISWNGSEPLL